MFQCSLKLPTPNSSYTPSKDAGKSLRIRLQMYNLLNSFQQLGHSVPKLLKATIKQNIIQSRPILVNVGACPLLFKWLTSQSQLLQGF